MIVTDGLSILQRNVSNYLLQVALSKITPSAKREGFATVPDTSWDDVGALDSVREELTMAILVGGWREGEELYWWERSCH